MSQQRIAFVGGGNMATSLIGGLLARGAAAADIIVADPDANQRERLERDFGVQTVGTATAAGCVVRGGVRTGATFTKACEVGVSSVALSTGKRSTTRGS